MPQPASGNSATSLELVRAEIFRFLRNPTPEVLCIRGKWGVGKTYAWDELLKQAGKDIALQSYSYVSLFGLDTLDRFKSSIFENVIPIRSLDSGPTMETLGKNLKTMSKLALSSIKPGVGAMAEHAAFLSIRGYIVCIDDLERKGDKLRVVDVLGLASHLKERRNCKIVLILNDDALEDEKALFEKHSEKVIDSSLVFAPTPEESIAIALKGTSQHDQMLVERCTKLQVSNIRVLKKLERLVHMVEPHLREFDPRVLQQAVSTLALFGWAVYEKKDGLLTHAVETRNRSRYHMGDEAPTEVEDDFDHKLEIYGFHHCDFFDRVLLEGINHGFFDVPELKVAAAGLDKEYQEAQTKQILEKPFDEYLDSFDDNIETIVREFRGVFNTRISDVSLSYLDAAVSFLKRNGAPEVATEAITAFMVEHASEPKSFFEPDDIMPMKDPDLMQALAEKLSSFTDNRDPADVLLKIAKDMAWNNEDIHLLAKVTPDDFYKMFKSRQGLELRTIAKRALEFKRESMKAGDVEYKTIGESAYEAILRLAAESPLNEERARSIYKVKRD